MGPFSQASTPCPLHADMLNSHCFCCQNWKALKTAALAVSLPWFPQIPVRGLHCGSSKQVSLHSLALYDVWLILFICIMHGNNVLSHIMWEAIALLAILTHLIPTRALWGKCAHYYLTDKETRHKEAEWHAKSQGGNWWSRVCIQAVCLSVFVLWILKMHVVYVYVSCVCMYIMCMHVPVKDRRRYQISWN